MKRAILISLFTIIYSQHSNAEYRVYQYVVKNKVNIKDAPNSHVIVSTLNPTTYIAYNGGSNLINVNLLRTWMCPGNTGQRLETCDSPYGRLPAEVLK